LKDNSIPIGDDQTPSDDGLETANDQSQEGGVKDEEVQETVKRGKGKPKIVIDKYIISCQKMFQKNNHDMQLTSNKNEK
jgi:hypothetical protein